MDRTNLPPPLMVSEPGSFAELTIVQRKPQIIADVIRYNDYPAEIVAALRAFQAEVASGPVQPLREDAPDAEFWSKVWQPWRGKGWRQLPWFFAETYFYRRLLKVVRYFQPGPWHLVDPFAPQKREALRQGLEPLAAFYTSLPQDVSLEQEFSLWLRRSLWGNRADLSNATLTAQAHETTKEGAERLLVDHTRAVWRMLEQAREAPAGRMQRLDLVTDNSGFELLCDLGLVDLLLERDLVQTVHMHLKGQPYFVSDAMLKDLTATLGALHDAQSPTLRALGHRLEQHRSAQRLVAHEHPFWATCLFFSALPGDLRSALAEANLIVLKGDVNYRRLLEDRHWPPTANLAEIASFMPAPFLALRTLKGELIVGLEQGVAEALAQQDAKWLINGERGVIHLVTTAGTQLSR